MLQPYTSPQLLWHVGMTAGMAVARLRFPWYRGEEQGAIRMIQVSGRKRNPLMILCVSVEHAEKVQAEMIRESFKNVRVIDDGNGAKLPRLKSS
jgi:hypothetical protein